MGATGWTSLIRNKGDRGASLMEFAFLMPLLLLIVLGIVELGFVLGQFNEVRHGAREGARLAAVNASGIGDQTCNAVGLGNSVTVDFTDASPGDLGQQGSVTVSFPVSSLSGLGFIEVFLPDALSSTAEFRLEQDSTNWNSGDQDRDPLGIACP